MPSNENKSIIDAFYNYNSNTRSFKLSKEMSAINRAKNIINDIFSKCLIIGLGITTASYFINPSGVALRMKLMKNNLFRIRIKFFTGVYFASMLYYMYFLNKIDRSPNPYSKGLI